MFEENSVEEFLELAEREISKLQKEIHQKDQQIARRDKLLNVIDKLLVIKSELQNKIDRQLIFKSESLKKLDSLSEEQIKNLSNAIAYVANALGISKKEALELIVFGNHKPNS